MDNARNLDQESKFQWQTIMLCSCIACNLIDINFSHKLDSHCFNFLQMNFTLMLANFFFASLFSKIITMFLVN